MVCSSLFGLPQLIETTAARFSLFSNDRMIKFLAHFRILVWKNALLSSLCPSIDFDLLHLE
jgi:hypothetical protein